MREDNSLVTASDCYDPTDSLLSTLLYGELLFPSLKFCSSNAIESLKLLGRYKYMHTNIHFYRIQVKNFPAISN